MQVRLAYALFVRAMFLSSTLAIIFIQSACAITEHSQSGKNIVSFFKSQLCVEDPGLRTPVLILPNGLKKPEN